MVKAPQQPMPQAPEKQKLSPGRKALLDLAPLVIFFTAYGGSVRLGLAWLDSTQLAPAQLDLTWLN